MELRILTIKTQKQKIMKKKFLGLALVAALGIPSFAAFAQQPAAKAETVCTAPDSCRKNCPCPFDGLNLTAQQQDKLKALKQAKLEQREAAREADKAARTEMKQNRRAKAVENRRADLSDIKSVLTPEQYVMFLENCYVYTAPDGKGMRPGKDGNRDFKKGDRRHANRDFKKDFKKDSNKGDRPQAKR